MLFSATLVMVVIGMLASVVSTRPQDQEDADMKAVEETVNYYFTGVANQDIESMKRAFHPDCKMMYVQNDALVQVTQDQWYERIRKTPIPKANYRRIVSIDIAGNAANVKAESDFPTFQFIDYLSLLKIEGQWKVVNKLFFRKEKL